MNVVADTNTVISGLLWTGASRAVLDNARAGKISLFTSSILVGELSKVLTRRKFSERLSQAGVQAKDLVLGYATLATVIKPAEIQPVVLADPDDDEVLACALACDANYIVSGDKHLLDLGEYQDIAIVTSSDFMLHLA